MDDETQSASEFLLDVYDSTASLMLIHAQPMFQLKMDTSDPMVYRHNMNICERCWTLERLICDLNECFCRL